jgi:hypothetical protein
MCRLTRAIDMGTTCISTTMSGATVRPASHSSTGNNFNCSVHHSFQGVPKASLRRRLGAKAQLEVKASRRLEIRRKATVAAEKNLEERGGCGGEKEIR